MYCYLIGPLTFHIPTSEEDEISVVNCSFQLLKSLGRAGDGVPTQPVHPGRSFLTDLSLNSFKFPPIPLCAKQPLSIPSLPPPP